MANYNKIILAGNLTRDPQLSYLPSNTAVVEFGLAINRHWSDQQGQKREETCFVDCRAYGRQAETINQYMAKGQAILIEGRLQFQQWKAQDGSRRSKHIVIVDTFQFLGGRDDSNDSSFQGGRGARHVSPPARTGAADSDGPEAAPDPAPNEDGDGHALDEFAGGYDPTPKTDTDGPPTADDDVPF